MIRATDHLPAPRAAARRRRGAIFITAMGVLVIVGGMLLVFAQEMRTEALASANRLSYAKADAIEQGAEQWVTAQVEANPGDAVTVTQTVAAGLQVGDGYFWVLHPDVDQPQQVEFGIVDESSKISLNRGNIASMLALVPNVPQEVSDSVGDWVDPDDTPNPQGGESSYYASLPEPYAAKNGPMETTEEISLVKGVTDQVLFGQDTNHNGVLDAVEMNAGSGAGGLNAAGGGALGLFPDLTVYSVEPNTAVDGTARLDVNGIVPNGIPGQLNPDPTRTRLQSILQKQLGNANDATTVYDKLLAARRGNNGFSGRAAIYKASGMTPDQWGKVGDYLTSTTSKTSPGLINANTASREVLLATGLSSAGADAIISKRGGANASSLSWVIDAIPAAEFQGVANYFTVRSFQYSADIVAVSGDGRSYKRVRIVVDGRTIPAKIVYRKDLTDLGWPLPPEVRTAMRAGQAPPQQYVGNNNQSGSGFNLGS